MELCFGDPCGCRAEDAWVPAKLQFLAPRGAKPKFGKTESRVRGYCGQDRGRKTRHTGFLSVLLLSQGAESGWKHAWSAGEAHPAPASHGLSSSLTDNPHPHPSAWAPSSSSLGPSLGPPTVSHPAWDCVISIPRPGLAAA